MTAIADTASLSADAPPTARSYAHAHWYFLAAFVAVVAGFWTSFFQPMDAGTPLKNIHGITSSLWYFALMTQSWLMARGLVHWHRRVAMTAFLLLPVLSFTALATTHGMFASSIIPPEARPVIAFIDFQLVAQLWVMMGLAFLNVRTPPAHKRFVAATALIGLPPALARLYDRLHIDLFGPIQTTLLTTDLILIVLIVVDRRNGESKRLAYPLMLAWNVAIQLLITPLSDSAWWLAFCRWYAAI